MDSLLEPLNQSILINLPGYNTITQKRLQKIKKSLVDFFNSLSDLEKNDSIKSDQDLLAYLKNLCWECALANSEDSVEFEDYLLEYLIFPQLAYINNLGEQLDLINLALVNEGNTKTAYPDMPHSQRMNPLEMEYQTVQNVGILQSILIKLESSSIADIHMSIDMSDSSDLSNEIEVQFSAKYVEFSVKVKEILQNMFAKFES